MFIGKDGGAQGCCQLVWHSSTEKQGMQFTLNRAGVHCCLVAEHLYAKSGCSRCKCSGTRLLSAGWHSSTEKQGMQFILNTAGVHWCLVAEHLYAKSGCS